MESSCRLGQPIGCPMAHEDLVRVVDFSPDGEAVLTGEPEVSTGIVDWDDLVAYVRKRVDRLASDSPSLIGTSRTFARVSPCPERM